MTSVFGPGSYNVGGSGSKIYYVQGSPVLQPLWKGDYNTASSYVPNDLIRYNEVIYICIKSSMGNLPTDTNYFYEFVQNGTNGTNGVSFVWRDTFQAGISYVQNDVVKYNGSVYMCVAPTSGNLPTNTSYFSLMCSSGDQGIQGIQGVQGIQGPQGISFTYQDNWYATSYTYHKYKHLS